jgi:glutamate-1-semialdehyde 2,1-aminomutase
MASLLDREKKVFAGNKFTRGPLQESWNLSDPRVPKFLLRGEGSRVFDEEGRSYVDYLCSFGATVLGYGDERVEAAAIAAARTTGGQLLSCPTHYSVELAERLVKQRPGVEWVLLAKNGSDVTTLARVAARAATGRRGILREAADGAPAYHGASPQWLGGRAGVLSEESHDHEGHYRYNDLASVEAAIAKMGGGDSIAAIFVGAASYPYLDRT